MGWFEWIRRRCAPDRQLTYENLGQIDRLLIVAGLPASGKSTFIRYLQSPEGADLLLRLSLSGYEGLEQTDFNKDFKKKLRHKKGICGDILFHYNISKHLIDGEPYLHRNALSGLIAAARKVTVITLKTTPQRLLQQYTDHRADKALSPESSPRAKQKAQRILELYNNPQELDALYGGWDAFIQSAGLVSYVVQHDGAHYDIVSRS